MMQAVLSTLIERDLRQCKFDSAAMKTVEALDGKL